MSLILVLVKNISLPSHALTLKTGIQYDLLKGQEINLRVSQIPSPYPWVDRDIEGKVIPPEIGDVIVSEIAEDIDLGTSRRLPAGTKLYARVKDLVEPKRFQRDGHIVLEFFKLESKNFIVNFSDKASAKVSTEREPSIMSKLKKSATIGAYTFGGALAGPLLTYQISGPFAGSLLTNPYVVGGAAGAGAAVGLASGIFKKGKLYSLEPGTELDLKLDNNWALALADPRMDKDFKRPMTKLKAASIDPNFRSKSQGDFDLEVLEIKKSRNSFGQKCLAVKLKYENFSRVELRSSSFQLIDSMGKEYYPTAKNFNDSFGAFPKKKEITLLFDVEFPKAPHLLKVVELFGRRVLASQKIVL